MDELNHTRLDLINAEINTTVVWLLALGLVILWALAHWFKRRLLTRPLQLAGFAVRIIIATVALWALWQALSRVILLTTGWKLWTHAFIGGLALEIVLALYQMEKRIVPPRIGRILLGLRIGAIVAVLIMLLQPVFGRTVKEEETRTVVVLVDDSASMQIADKQMSVEERVNLAQFYGIDAAKNRPPVGAQFALAAAMRARLDQLADALEAPDGFGVDAEAGIIEKQSAPLADLTRESLMVVGPLRQALRDTPDLPDDARRAVDRIDNSLKEEFQNRLRDAESRLKQKRLREARGQVQQAAAVLGRALEQSGYMTQLADNNFYQKVAPEIRQKIDAVAARTRAELARETMERPREGGKSLLDMLREKYAVQLVRFGKKSSEVADWNFPPQGQDEEFRLRTDLTSALEKIRKSYEAENLAGVLLLSDVRHNTDKGVDDVAKALNNQKSPVCPVIIGSQRGSKDAAIVTVQAPQAIYQGDRIRAKVELRADGLRGRTVKLKLLQDGGQVAEERVVVPDDTFRTTVRMVYQPKVAGIFNYQVKIDPMEGELFANNNEWSFKTAVSEDRTNVLLIDDRPRWEFRYLRNLFDSRDKSVHLQYYLLHPDQLEGEGRPTNEAASAARKFGDSEAGRLPEKPEDWKKFDAIIVGDLPPAALGEKTWEVIRECVEERGALLVLSAGAGSMPHAYSNEAFRELCPALYEQNAKSYAQPPEQGYRIERTAEGLGHFIMEQTRSSAEENRIIWESMPILRWRHPIQSVKEGAEVLAYAKPAQLDSSGNEIKSADPFATFDPAALQKQKDFERKNALVVVSQFGTGKVAMLLTDHTWRFRYGVGDTYHHKFWGQMLRWGAGENLRAGTELVRLGTEKLTYEAGEEIKLLAKLQEQDYRPVANSEVVATIFKGAEKILRQKLDFQSGSHGMYEAVVKSLTEPGDYRLELSGPDVDRLFRASNTTPGSNGGDSILATQFTVASALNPIEFGDLSVDRELAANLAGSTGGVVSTPADAARAVACFGPGSKEKEDYKETRLWDNWALLGAAVALLTAEWIYRRRGGLI